MIQDPILKELVFHREDCTECKILLWRWEEGESDRLTCDVSREIFERWLKNSNELRQVYQAPQT